MLTFSWAPHCQGQLDTTRWRWRTRLGTSQSPQMAAADKFSTLIVLCPRTCWTRGRLLQLSKRKITPAQPFPSGNDYAFVATEGAPWQAAQAPQVMAATGGAAETLAFRGGAEKGEDTLSESPTQTAQGKPICQSGKWPFPFTCD